MRNETFPTISLLLGAKLRSTLDSDVASKRSAGAAQLVMIDGHQAYSHSAGYRDIGEKLPFTLDTVVRMYSMTKPITSVVAMMLHERGAFLLDDPISKYIPEFAAATVLLGPAGIHKPVKPKRPLTVRDCFRHTTGYSYGDDFRVTAFHIRENLTFRQPSGMYPPDLTIEQAASAMARIPAVHHPGEKFTYGHSTDLLGRLIEIWAGKPLDRVFDELIIKPLGMKDTAFQIDSRLKGRFASTYYQKDGELIVQDSYRTSDYNKGFKFLAGGSGLVSTIRDYAIFCNMLVNNGKHGRNQIIKADTLQQMFTDQLAGVAGGFQFGLGFAIDNLKVGAGSSSRMVKSYAWSGYASTTFQVIPELKLVNIIVQQQVPTYDVLGNTLSAQLREGLSL
jgi:CubicO group peptidase (beta-lactamase class C family)